MWEKLQLKYDKELTEFLISKHWQVTRRIYDLLPLVASKAIDKRVIKDWERNLKKPRDKFVHTGKISSSFDIKAANDACYRMVRSINHSVGQRFVGV